MKILKKRTSFFIPIQIWLPIVYVLLGFLWIVYSDKCLLKIVDEDIQKFVYFQTYKGWIYVLVTGILLFFLLWRYNRRTKRYISLIETARKNAEKANKLKSTFLSNLSHELRTPMNAINGFSDLIKQYVTNPDESKQYHAIVRENSYKLLRIIENILDMSKIQVNLLELHISTFSINKLCDALQNSAEEFVPHEKFIHVVKPANDDFTLTTDFERVLRVCEILLLNSISNTGKGNLLIFCKPEHDSLQIEFYWEESLHQSDNQMQITEHPLEFSDSIGWDIAFGITRLLQGTLKVYKLSDNTYRFTLHIPQTTDFNENTD